MAGKMQFNVTYWPEQHGDPAFWWGYTDIIEADSLEEAEQKMLELYGNCNPYLSGLNEAAKEAERRRWEKIYEPEPLPF